MADKRNKPVAGASVPSVGTDIKPDVVDNSINGIPVESFGGAGSSGTDAGAPKRGRGRPPGSGTRPAVQTSRVDDLGVYAGALVGVHEVAAFLLSVPEFEIDEDEALTLAKALQRLQKFYPSVDVPAQALAWIGLFSACGKVYGTRVAAYKLRKSHEKAKSKEKTVVHAWPDTAVNG